MIKAVLEAFQKSELELVPLKLEAKKHTVSVYVEIRQVEDLVYQM